MKAAKRPYRIDFYRDTNAEHRWRIKHRNGRIIADCGEGYKNKADCHSAIQHFLTDIAVQGQLDCVCEHEGNASRSLPVIKATGRPITQEECEAESGVKIAILHTRDGLEVLVEVPSDAGTVLIRPMRGLLNQTAERLKGKAKYEELLRENTRRYELQGWKADGTPVYYEA